jgi:hypothetical protein
MQAFYAPVNFVDSEMGFGRVVMSQVVPLPLEVVEQDARMLIIGAKCSLAVVGSNILWAALLIVSIFW